MARRRFFVAEVRRGYAELTGADAEHLVRVLRAEAGELHEISNNATVYLAEIEEARKSRVLFRVVEELPVPATSVVSILLPALFKFDRFEWLVEKATELGIEVLAPWEAIRTERGLAQAAAKRSARWERIALEASQQARRARLPRVERVVRLEEALATPATVKLLLDEDAGARPLRQVLPERRCASDRVALLSGPEGGLTDNEREQAIAAGWKSCSLGHTILRAETAPIAGLAIIQAEWQGAND